MEDINFQLPPIQPEPQVNPTFNQPIIAPLIQESPKSPDKKNSIFYVLSGIVILFLLAACYVLAFHTKDVISLINKKKNNGSTIVKTSQVTTTAVNSTSTATNVATKTAAKKINNLSPKDTYLVIKTEEDNLNAFDDYVNFMNEYGSKAKIAEMNENLSKADSLPADFKEQVISLIKTGSPVSADITNIQETITGNNATLNVSTKKPELKGKIDLVLENGIWKLENETWTEVASAN